MSFDKNMGFEPYTFKFDGAIQLFIKSPEEIREINKHLKDESPKSNYKSYSWYLTEEKIEKLKYKKVKVLNQVFWHGGLPYYLIEIRDGARYEIAEFYCRQSFKYKPDSEGLILHDK